MKLPGRGFSIGFPGPSAWPFAVRLAAAAYALLLFCLPVLCLAAPRQSAAVAGGAAESAASNSIRPIESPAPTELAARLGLALVFRSNFAQEKRVAALSRPLRSKGSIVFSAERGLCWTTELPFRSRLIVLPEGIYLAEEGAAPEMLGGREQAPLRGFTDVLLALFSGNAEALEAGFSVEVKEDSSGWELLLRPRERVVRRFIDTIRMNGAAGVLTSLEITEAGGDTSVIRFLDLRREPPQLSADEELCFAR